MKKELGFDSRKGQKIFLFSTALRPALRPIQLPIELDPGWRLSPDVGHSSPSSAEVKNVGAVSFISHNILPSFSQHVSAVHGHHQVSLIP
jgi:hypothetical protein